MNSFLRVITPNRNSQEANLQKYSIRRLEPSIKKFIKVVEIDLNRLERHRVNFEKFNRLEDWNSLNRELINASRTVQQIKANIKEIEKTREQIIDDDVEKFDLEVEDVKQHAAVFVNEFLEIFTHIEVKKITHLDRLSPDRETKRSQASLDSEIQALMLTDCDELILTNDRLHLHAIPDDTDASESSEHLKEGLQELNDLFQCLATTVHTQKESLDSIEQNIDHADVDVKEGTKYMGKASKLKRALLPVAGALLGGAVGGPIGFVAGLKIGAVVAVGGGLLGFASGSLIKRRQNRNTDIELKNLSRSKSLTDLND